LTAAPPPSEAPGSPPPQGRKNRSLLILVNTLTSYMREILDIGTFLIITPFLIRTLGKDGFGLWSLVWSVVGLFALADLGFSASVVKYVADARGRGNVERARTVICTSFWIYFFIGIGLMILTIVCSLVFNDIFDIQTESQRQAARTVLLILGFRMILTLPLGMFRGVLIGNQQYKIANLYRMCGSLLYLGGVLFFLQRSPHLWVLALVNLVTGVVPMLAMLFHARMTIPGISFHPRNFDRSVVRELAGFSIYFFLIQTAMAINVRVDAMIIKSYLPLEAVAVYAIAMRLSEKSSIFCSQLARTLTPMVAELHGAGEKKNILKVWKMGTKLTTAFGAPLLVGLGILAAPLIRSWCPPGFEEAVPATHWLVAAVLVRIIHANTNNVLSMMGHHRFMAFVYTMGQAANIGLSILLLQPLGIEGVALATFLVQFPLFVFVVQPRALKIFGVRQLSFYRDTILPSLVPVLLMAGLLILLQIVDPWESLLTVAVFEVLGIGLFAFSFWWLGFSPKERSYFREKILGRLNRTRPGG